MNRKGVFKISAFIMSLVFLTFILIGCEYKSLQKRVFEELEIGYVEGDDINDVKNDILLPNDDGRKKTTIVWESSDESVIKVEDDKGIVYGQRESTTVTLTLSVTIKGKTKTKEYELLVTKTDIFIVKFLDHDNKVLKKEEVELGKDATAPKNPTRTGHTFIKWDKDFTDVESDLIINAVYERYSYQITFYDDDRVTILEQYILPYGDMPMPETPTKDGYEFTGWDKELTPATESKSYFATYENIAGETFTITYLNEDGTVFRTIEILEGQYVNHPSGGPTKVGYGFVGWLLNGEIFNTGKVESDLTLTPSFTAQNVDYVVEYYVESLDSEGYEIFGDILEGRALADSELTIDLPSHNGLKVKEGQVTTFTILADGSLVIKVYYDRLTFNVTFGGDADDQVVKFGGVVTKPANPEKENYDFVAWLHNDEEYDFSSPVTGDLALEASFEYEKHLVIFKDYDGTILKEEEVTHGDRATAPANPDNKENYHFVKWDTSLNNITKDTIITAIYEINEYEITFINESKETIIIIEHGEMPTIDNPTKESTNEYRYVFTGWTPEIVVATKDTTYTAVYDAIPKEYKLTWVVNGEDIVETYPFGATINELTEISKEGYDFVKWDIEVPSTMPANDLVITAEWEIKSYTVTFYVEDELFDTKTVTYNNLVNKPADPTVEGKEFGGWLLNGNIFNFETNKVRDNISLMAAFDAETFTITFINGSEESHVNVIYGSMPTIDNPTKESTDEYTYVFTGWTPEIVVATKDTTYTAVYDAIPKEYKLTWVVNGENIVETYPFGATINELTGMTKTGHTFREWDVEVPVTMPATNVRIEALWDVNSYTVTYLVDGVEFDVKTYNYLESISYIDEPTKEGYTFDGWKETLPQTMPASNLTINGSYTINKYIVRFEDHDGTELAVREVEYMNSATAPSNPTRTGYRFISWDKEFDEVKEDLVITAQYEIREYNVQFQDYNSSTIETIKVEYNKEVEAITAPTRDGYIFIGWLLNEELYDFSTPITKNIVLRASYKENILPTINTKRDLAEVERLSTITSYEELFTIEVTDDDEGFTYEINSSAVNINKSGEYEVIVTAEDIDGNVVTKTLIVRVTPILYTIIFETNGGTIPPTQEVLEGNLVKNPRIPFKDGYQFIGWELNDQEFNFSNALPLYESGSKEITIKALWEEVEEEYTVTIRIDDNTVIVDQYLYGQLIEKPETPSRDGYILVGWENIITKSEWNFLYDGVTTDMVLEPKWARGSEIEQLLEDSDHELKYYQEFENVSVFLTKNNGLYVSFSGEEHRLNDFLESGQDVVELFAVSLMSTGLPRLLIKTDQSVIYAGVVGFTPNESTGEYTVNFIPYPLPIDLARDESVVYAKFDNLNHATIITSKQKVYVIDASDQTSVATEVTSSFNLSEGEEFVVDLNHREHEFNNLLMTNKDRYFIPSKYTQITHEDYYLEVTNLIEDVAINGVVLVENMFQILTVIDGNLNRHTIIVINEDDGIVESEYSDVTFLEGEEIIAHSETYLISNLNRIFYIKPDQEEGLYEIEIMDEAFMENEEILNIYSGVSMSIIETKLDGETKYYILENMAFNNNVMDVSFEINDITNGSTITASYNGTAYIIITESGIGLVVR